MRFIPFILFLALVLAATAAERRDAGAAAQSAADTVVHEEAAQPEDRAPGEMLLVSVVRELTGRRLPGA
jgi:hypothetical protein